MKSNNKLTTACFAAAALCFGIPSAAAAPDFSVVFPAGLACSSFDLQIDGWGGNQHFKEFKDKNGFVRSISAGTGAALLYTNLDTGKTFSTKSNGAVTHVTSNPDGSSTITITGHNVLILFPTDSPAGPSTTLYAGRVVFTNVLVSDPPNADYWMSTVTSESGKKTDICAAVD